MRANNYGALEESWRGRSGDFLDLNMDTEQVCKQMGRRKYYEEEDFKGKYNLIHFIYFGDDVNKQYTCS